MNTRPIFGLWAIVVGVVLCAIGVWILLRPMEYQAAVKVEISSDEVHLPDGAVSYDPYFLQTDFEVILSKNVLSNVVETLNLEAEWGKRYAAGRILGMDETIDMLRMRMNIKIIPNTRIVEIRVTDEDPYKAAQIANEIANVHNNYLAAQREKERITGIKILEEDCQKEEVKISAMQAHLEELRKQSNLTNNESADVLKAHDPEYYKAGQQLDNEKKLLELLTAKVEFDKSDTNVPKWIPSTTIDPAVPPKSPSGPGRKLGADLLACGLMITGFGFYSIRNTGIRGQIKSNAV